MEEGEVEAEVVSEVGGIEEVGDAVVEEVSRLGIAEVDELWTGYLGIRFGRYRSRQTAWTYPEIPEAVCVLRRSLSLITRIRIRISVYGPKSIEMKDGYVRRCVWSDFTYWR